MHRNDDKGAACRKSLQFAKSSAIRYLDVDGVVAEMEEIVARM
jgi:hypothetical protein